jgi:hypothetical protein
MRKQTFFIAGEKRPVVFSHGTIFDYEVATGRPFTHDFANVVNAMALDPTTVPVIPLMDICICGLREGAAQSGIKFEMTGRELFMATRKEADMEVLGEIVLLCAQSMPNQKDDDAATEGDGAGETKAAS